MPFSTPFATSLFLLSLAITCSTIQATTPPVSVQGNAFFAGGKRFYLRGIDYQPGGSSNLTDPLSDPEICRRDLAQFKELGINTVRVYTVDNRASHKECMAMYADAGIYVAIDVNTPKYSINRKKPEPSYNAVYLQNVFATIDAFAKFDNTLLFFSGNEVINDNSTTNAAPFVKATTRDMKAYIASRKYRRIPVGYSAADVDMNRLEMAAYMNCGPESERSDFFSFNDYSWCDPSSFQISGWDRKVAHFRNYGIPLFLSEFGCNTNRRQFSEIAALYSPSMTPVYSGGLVYEYSEEGSRYGLVKLTSRSTVTKLPDFQALKVALARSLPPSGLGGARISSQSGTSGVGAASSCPMRSMTWAVSPKDPLPTLPANAASYMRAGAGPGPGLKGDGSQDAGADAKPPGTGADEKKGNRKQSSAALPLPGSPLLSASVLLALIFSLFL